MRTKTLIRLVATLVAVCGAASLLVPTGQGPREPVSASPSTADPRSVAWLGAGYQERELFDGNRSHPFLFAADVPVTDAEAVVRAIRQGQLINKLPRASTFYQIPEVAKVSIRKGSSRPGRAIDAAVAEYDVLTHTSYDGSSGDGLRVRVRDGQVEVREVFYFIHG